MTQLKASAVIGRMYKVTSVETDTALGEYLKLRPSTVGGWRARNHVPYKECVALAKAMFVRLDWLLLGLGAMDGSPGSQVADDSDPDTRMQRLIGFFAHWNATRTDDENAWLEMQLARAVPEYADWVAHRGRAVKLQVVQGTIAGRAVR